MGKITKLLKEKKHAESRNDWREVANLCNIIGGELQNNRDLEGALREHKEELQACTILDDKLGCGVAHRRIGEVLCDMDRTEEALQHQEQHLQLAIEARSVVEQQRAYVTLGNTYLHQAENSLKSSERCSALNSAKMKFLEALKKCKVLSGDSIAPAELALMRARVYINLGLVAKMSNDDNRAIDLLTQASKITRQYLFKEDQYRCHYLLASIYLKQEKSAAALEEAKFIVHLSKKSSTSQQIEALITLTSVNSSSGRDLDAKTACYKAYKIALHNKGNISELKPYALACKQLHKLQSVDSQDISQEQLMKNYETMGDCYCKIKCYNKAIECYKQVIDEATAIGKPKEELAPIYYSIGQTYKENGQFREALQYFKTEYDIKVLKDPQEACKTLLIIAEVAEYLEEPVHVLEKYYVDCFNLASKVGDPKLQVHVLKQHKEFSHLSKAQKEAISQRIKDILDKHNLNSDCELSENEDEEEVDTDDSLSAYDVSSDDDEDEECQNKQSGRGAVVIGKKKNSKVNIKGETPLHVACIENKYNEVKKLIEAGDSLTARDNAGWQPLHEACNGGFYDIVELLLSAGAPVNVKSKDGVTPLYDAACNGHIPVMKLLLDAGSSPLIRCNDGQTPYDALKTFEDTELTAEEREQLQAMLKELKDAMEKAGCKVASSPPPGGSGLNRFRAVSSNRTRNKTSREEQVSSDEEQNVSPPSNIPKKKANAVKRYRDAISCLGSAASRGTHPIEAGPSTTMKKAPAIGLVEEQELVGDDFIEDDLGTTSSRKRKRPKSMLDFVSSKKEKRSSDQTNVEVSRCSQRKKCSSATRQSTLTSIYDRYPSNNIDDSSNDAFDDLFNTDNIYHIDDSSPVKVQTSDARRSSGSPVFNTALSSRPLASVFSNLSSNSSPETADDRRRSPAIQKPPSITSIGSSTLRLHVTVEDKTLLVPIAEANHSCTIEWLAAEVSRRYYQLTGIKPELNLSTSSGALLLPSDPITQVLDSAHQEQLKAIVTGWALPPLQQRYTQECRNFSLTPSADVLSALTAAESSAVLDLSSSLCALQDLKPVMRALQRHQNLHSLNLSFTRLGDAGFTLLLESLSLLPALSTLTLHTVGITSKALSDFCERINKEDFNASKSSLSNIDMSYNSLLGATFNHIVSLLSLPLISSLVLNHCMLDIQHTTTVKQCLSLQRLELQHNAIHWSPLKLLLSSLPSLRHLSLTGVSCSPSEGNSIASCLSNLLGAGDECQLEHLELSHTDLTANDLALMVPYLYRCPHLVSFGVAHNPKLSSESLVGLLTELESNVCVPVRSLSMHGIQCPPESTLVDSLIKFIQTKFTLQKPLQSLSIKSNSKVCSVVNVWKSIFNGKSKVNCLGNEIFLSVV